MQKKKSSSEKISAQKKPTKRSRSKYPALDPSLNLRSRRDLFENDYIHKLSEKDKAWLNKFNNEYINDVIDRKNLKKNLHNTQALKKDCDDRNNSRARCIFTRQKAGGDLVYTEDKKTYDFVDDVIVDELNADNVTIDFHNSSNSSDEDTEPTK
jgi:hypothetical protein